MHKITRSQTVLKAEAEEALCSRKMVYLAGQPNGKTSIMWRIIGDKAVSDQGLLIDRVAPRKSGDFEVMILPKIGLPHRDRLTISYFMRQVLRGCGDDKAWNIGSYQLNDKYLQLMNDLRARRVIPCVAIDNAELIPERGFTILKHLHEMRNPLSKAAEQIGIALLVAGRFGKIRFPGSFLQHCTEIQIGKISHDEEIRELIQTHFPHEAESFSDPALRRITKYCETTLQVMRAARMSIAERRRLREKEVYSETVDTVLSGMGIELAKAA